MDWMNKVTGILQQYAGADASATPPDVHEHFDSVAQAVPKDVLAQGLAAAFNSNQTPDFGLMLGNLFSQSSPDQKAGMLNQLLVGAGPGVLAQLLPGSSGTVTPEMANQVTPEAVEAVAAQAHKQNPTIIDAISRFYAEHPTLVKTLGATVLSIAISRMSKRAT